jgi:hypothetical protein
MSTPIAQGSALQGTDLEPRHRAEPSDASEGEALPRAPSPPFDGSTPAPDAEHRAIADDEGAMAAAVARLDDAVQFAVDLAAPSAEPEAVAAGAEPAQDGDGFAPLTEDRGLFAEDVLFALPGFQPDDMDSEVQPAGDRANRVRHAFVRYGLMVGAAAVVAYGLTTLPLPQVSTGLDLPARMADSIGAVIAQVKTGTIPAARLFVKDQQAFANEPLPIEISVEHAVKDTSLRLDGLAAGTRLSAGAPVGIFSWQFPLRDLKSLYLYAPTGFVGVMNSGVDLFGPDKRLIDRRDVRFEWLATKKNKPQPATVESIEAKTPVAHPRIGADLAETLMARGQGFLDAGDIGAARILFERLADADVADGALALAKTYDPHYLASHKVIGLAGDAARARTLYRRAMQLGSAEASRMFEQATRN